MTQDTVKASKILFDLVQTLEPRLAPLDKWFFGTLLPQIAKWRKSEGDQGVKRAKDILGRGWLLILGEDPGDALPFVRTTNGVPDLVSPLVQRVNRSHKDARLLSATLTLIRVTDLFMAQGDEAQVVKQLRVINDSRIPSTAKKVVAEFKTFVHEFLASCPDNRFKEAYKAALSVTSHKEMTLETTVGDFFSEKRGPNGSLTLEAAADYVTNRNYTFPGAEKSFKDQILSLGAEVCKANNASIQVSDPWLDVPDDVLTGGKTVSTVPGKISQITEKSGKTRLVASPDYYSQQVMKPIHNWLMSLLKTLPEDCTFDQRSSIPKIVSWQGRGSTIYSFDQSSCTDLFPVVCQLNILAERFGEPLAEATRTVMCDREWSIKLPSGRTKLVHWGVGQPMGLYGSWPLMAVTHHLLVQYAAWRSSGRKSFRPFQDYVICGDDIVIASKSVAESYLKVVRALGMKVNLTKSHVTGGKTGIDPVSEFAKITIWKGKPLFPVRPNMVRAAVKDWRMVVPLFFDLINRDGFSARKKYLTRVIKKWFPSKARILIPLLDVPTYFGGLGFGGNTPLRRQFQDLKTNEIHPWLYFLGSVIRSNILLEQRQLSLPKVDLPREVLKDHPMMAILKEAEETSNLNQMNFMFPGPETVPSAEEICEEILVDGLGRFKPFLKGIESLETDAPLPNWEQENSKKQMRMRSLWEKSLKKSHFVSTGRVLETVGPFGLLDCVRRLDSTAQFEWMTKILTAMGLANEPVTR